MKMFFRWRRFSWKNKLSSSDYQYNSWSCIIIFLENYEWANFPKFISREFFFVERLCHADFQVSRNWLQNIRIPATRLTWLCAGQKLVQMFYSAPTTPLSITKSLILISSSCWIKVICVIIILKWKFLNDSRK